MANKETLNFHCLPLIFNISLLIRTFYVIIFPRKEVFMYKNILFDLDGTIVDSREGIINGFIYSLKYFKIDVKNKSELEQFIGPPLVNTFMEYYGLTKEQSDMAIKKYREQYHNIGVFQAELYEGINELIHILNKNGKRILLATSKPEVFANKILEKFRT